MSAGALRPGTTCELGANLSRKGILMLTSAERERLEVLQRSMLKDHYASMPYVPRTSGLYRDVAMTLQAVLNAEIAFYFGNVSMFGVREQLWKARAALDLWEHNPALQGPRKTARTYPEEDAILARLLERF